MKKNITPKEVVSFYTPVNMFYEVEIRTVEGFEGDISLYTYDTFKRLLANARRDSWEDFLRRHRNG